MLELTNVRLHADALPGFDHTFADGEIAVVLGANQSGKTDLCRLIAGLNTCAQGQVRIDGVDLADKGPRNRPVSMVYQAFVNYPNLTVAENIASPLRAARLPQAQIVARVNELATKLQIEDLLSRLPEALSGGQQQRLAIARALAKNARVLLLDEPLVNLDFKLREALEVELRELLTKSETSVIYTSSNPTDAFTLGDQLVLLADGKKVQSGTPIEVYRQPVNLTAMQLLADPGVNQFAQDDALCAVRPEHVSVDTQDARPGELRFQMSVTAYETSGDESFVHGRVADRDWVVRCRGMLHLQAGQQLGLVIQERDVVRF